MLATQNEEIDVQVKPSTRSETIPLGDYKEGRKTVENLKPETVLIIYSIFKSLKKNSYTIFWSRTPPPPSFFPNPTYPTCSIFLFKTNKTKKEKHTHTPGVGESTWTPTSSYYSYLQLIPADKEEITFPQCSPGYINHTLGPSPWPRVFSQNKGNSLLFFHFLRLNFLNEHLEINIFTWLKIK